MNILIIDESSDDRNQLQELLTPYGTCHAAGTCAEALIAVDGMMDRMSPYRLICLGLSMPGQDGQAILKKIRALERQRGLKGRRAAKIIVTKAVDDTTDISKVLNQGACDGCLTKPLDQAKMRKLLNRHGIRPLAPSETTPA